MKKNKKYTNEELAEAHIFPSELSPAEKKKADKEFSEFIRNKRLKNQKIITGITIVEQMRKEKKILKNQVIPKEKQYQKLNNNMKEFIQTSIDTLDKQMSILGAAKEQTDNNNSKRLLSVAITNIQTAKFYLKEAKDLGYNEFTLESPIIK